ncbi:Polar-differentiation response regulator DivK [bioreactor metagenome]|uniref:Polar-differentiation response regulator DivK n=1 Tax=bioreactor metagenome TaxID=1076179 RepID=A0A645HMS7_9ZZZZ
MEDNPDNMITVKALLSEDYRVMGAEDGETGVALAKEHVPDLILMDIALPGISGIEAYRQIRENLDLKDVPVVALTASAMEEERETILSHGFDAFIEKPIATVEFYKVIGEIINGR